MRLALFLFLCPLAPAQQSQNPSPMVEHTRTHPRLTESHPPGRREKLSLGTLFIPASLHPHSTTPLLIFFHGGDWVPELAAVRNHVAVITVQAGSGSAAYARLFPDAARFPALLTEAEQKAGAHFAPIYLGGWSAGYGAIREILKSPGAYARVSSVLLIDGMHTGYIGDKPGPVESKIDPDPMAVWVQFARDAVAGRKRFLVTHSEIFPGTFASTTETSDYLIAQLGLKLQPVLRWGPMGLQQLSEVRAGRFEIRGFAGNSAPDHVDQLHSLPVLLHALLK